jgi:hypothetical protein
LDFVRKGLKSAALVRGCVGPVLLKLDNGLEAEGGGSDLRFEDSDKVGGGCFREVDDDWLQGNGSVGLLADSFGEREVGETLF